MAMPGEGHTWDRVSGLAIGLILGVAAGLLFAPRSGEETRATIKQKAQESVDQIRETVVQPVFEQLKTTVVEPVKDQSRRILSRETELTAAPDNAETSHT
jgi:gas vesicle protein